MRTITHEQYKADIETLAEKIKNAEKTYSGIYGVPRGGTYPAAMLSQMTGIQQVFNPAEITESTLIVDDLIDSGATLAAYTNDKAVVYCKPGMRNSVTYYGSSTENEWLVFPDESGSGIEENFKRTLEYIGEDTTREGLLETPKRMRRAYDEIFSGYKTDPNELIKTFTQGTCKEMVILKNCEFFSTCEHHFFPFFGHISIGYIPNDKVIGVSKLARLVDCFSKRMQIQERMTAQIADFLEQELGAKGVYVVCEGVHFCMTSRGIKKQDASMVTSAIRGLFKENAQARNEFLALVK
jgi:GTP cyclohydrolase I